MRKQQYEVLQDITKIQTNQKILLDKPQIPQQQFLQIYGQRLLLSKKMIHRNIDQVLGYLTGSFGANALRLAYMNVCLENRIQLPMETYPVLKMLVDWADFYQQIGKEEQLGLNDIVFQNKDPVVFKSVQEYITYLNIIASDLTRILKNIKLDAEDILTFIWGALPRVLFNILLPKEVVPALRQQKQSIQCLFKQRGWQYFLRSKANYALLLKALFKTLLEMQIKGNFQKQLMDLIFRYFYAYHHDKKYQATDLFIQAFNSLSEAARVALKDEFILFFRVLRKIGKIKFIEFLTAKSQWIKELLAKVDNSSLVGYPKDTMSPFNNAGLCEIVGIQRGKVESRYVQVLEDYSMVYFIIEALSLDVTVRLNFLGSIQGKPFNTLLSEQVKLSGQFKSNFLALKRGLYRFDFDNSYSWINGKSVRFEHVVLEPVQIQSQVPCKWKQAYFEQIPTTQLCEPYQPHIVKATNQSVQQQQQQQQQRGVTGKAVITKNGTFLNLKITKSNNIYEFQTQDEDKFVSRCSEMNEKDDSLQWTLFDQPLNAQELGPKLAGKKAPQTQKKVEKKVQKIEATYEEEQEESGK